MMLKFYPCRNSKARLKPSARKFNVPDRLAPSLARIRAPYRPQIIPLRQLRGTFCLRSSQAKPRAKTHPSQEILSPTEFPPPPALLGQNLRVKFQPPPTEFPPPPASSRHHPPVRIPQSLTSHFPLSALRLPTTLRSSPLLEFHPRQILPHLEGAVKFSRHSLEAPFSPASSGPAAIFSRSPHPSKIRMNFKDS